MRTQLFKKLFLQIFCGVVFFATIVAPLNARAQNQGGDQLIVLPMLGYSDEQGMGIGANAAWLGVGGSPWDLSLAGFGSTMYQQTVLYGTLLNRDFLGNMYFEFTGGYTKSDRSLFYGFGNDTGLANPAQYGIIDGYYLARVGVKVQENLYVGLGLGHKSSDIRNGTDSTLQQYSNVYAGTPRLNGTATTYSQAFALYEARTPRNSPQDGLYGLISLDQAQPRSTEDLSFQRVIIHGKGFFPVFGDSKDFLLASQVRLERIWGEDIPFNLLPRLGSDTTLRGYRSGRFIENASMLISNEIRWMAISSGGSVFTRFELHLGNDYGRVFGGGSWPPSPFVAYHNNWVLGITGLLTSGIPLRFDYATGPEGGLIYLHLFYPF